LIGWAGLLREGHHGDVVELRRVEVGRSPQPDPFEIRRFEPRSAQRRARVRFLARRIHALGERPLFEMFCELDAGADFTECAERYAALPAGLIKALGGDRLADFRLIDGDSDGEP
jgi:hypothetical protein